MRRKAGKSLFILAAVKAALARGESTAVYCGAGQALRLMTELCDVALCDVRRDGEPPGMFRLLVSPRPAQPAAHV